MSEGFLDRYGNNIGPAQRSHVAELFLLNQFYRLQAESRCQHAIIRRWRSATLNVSEHRHTRFNAGLLLDLGAEPVPDAAQLRVAELVNVAAFRENLMGFIRRRAFGNDDNCELTAAINTFTNQGTDLIEVEFPFRARVP